MSIIYVSDAETKLGIEENRIIAVGKDDVKKSIPIHSVEG